MTEIKALFFDVFGTVVDWRGSIARLGGAMSDNLGAPNDFDWYAFADAWRSEYQPAMAEVRTGRRPYTRLDTLHRENLDRVLPRFGLEYIDEDARENMNLFWHRLDAWPDSVPGLLSLKSRFIIATMSNGNTAMMVNMAKHAKLPWDCILGADPAGHYKPDSETYLTGAEWLDLQPSSCLMVAAHNVDLAAAQANGLRTAFISRPSEYGTAQTSDLSANEAWDYVADSIIDLADQLNSA